MYLLILFDYIMNTESLKRIHEIKDIIRLCHLHGLLKRRAEEVTAL